MGCSTSRVKLSDEVHKGPQNQSLDVPLENNNNKLRDKKQATVQSEKVAALKKEAADEAGCLLLAPEEEKAKYDGKKEAPLGPSWPYAKEISAKWRKEDLRRRNFLLSLSAEEDQLHLELETKFTARARGKLGISQREVEAALSDVHLDIKPRCGSPGAIRILQWNILADGLAKDGFLVRDVLSETMDDSARQQSFNNKQDESVLKDVSSDESLNAPAQVSASRSKKNLHAVVDWKLRFLMIQKYVLTAKADVIVLQEVDHMLEMQEVLGQMGYACSRDGKTYIPAHKAMEEHGVKRDSAAFFTYLRNADVAFVPKTNSACRKLGLGERKDADNDGVAIFWRRDVLELADLDFLVFDDPKRNQGAVRATLKRTEDGTRVAVIAAHLSSGSGSKDEEARLKECKAPSLDADGYGRGPSLCEWIDASARMAPTVTCLDANSVPNTKRVEYEASKLNVWEALCSARPGIRSVWAAFYGPDGTPRQTPSPVTTNKIRGPLSAQAEKIGEHAFGLMDQMFFTACFSLLQHAYTPATFIGGEGDARGQLLPSLKVPSDHYPVIADIQLPIGLVTAWVNETDRTLPDNVMETLAQTMTGQTSPARALLLKRQQLASEEQLIKLWYVRNWVTTVVGMSTFHDDLETCAQGTLTTTQGERIGELLPKLARSDSNKGIQFADAGAWLLAKDVVRVPTRSSQDSAVDVELRLHCSAASLHHTPNRTQSGASAQSSMATSRINFRARSLEPRTRRSLERAEAESSNAVGSPNLANRRAQSLKSVSVPSTTVAVFLRCKVPKAKEIDSWQTCGFLASRTACSEALFEIAEKGHADVVGLRLVGWRLTDVVMLLAVGGARVDNLAPHGVLHGNAPLHIAARKGHVAVIEALLAAGAAVDTQDKDGASPLYIGAQEGQAAVVEALLAGGAAKNLQMNDAGGWAPLHAAAVNGHLAALEALLAAGATKDLRNAYGRAPLHFAAQKGQVVVVEALLKAGAVVDLMDEDGETPLDKSEDRLEVQALLRAHGGRTKDEISNQRKNLTKLSIFQITSHDWTSEVEGANFGMNTDESSRLTNAESGQTVDIEEMLSVSAAVDQHKYNGRLDSMHYNEGDGHLEITEAPAAGPAETVDGAAYTPPSCGEAVVEALLAAGAAVDLHSNNGWSLLKSAEGRGHGAVVEALLAAGAAVDLQDKYGYSHMHIAAHDGYVVVVAALIAAGAQVNLQAKDGRAPLHIAAEKGHGAVVEALLAAGADGNLQNKDGWSPLHYLSDNGHANIVEDLLAAGADVDLQDVFGWSPLHIAAGKGYEAVVEALLAAGTDRNLRNNNGWSHLYIASLNGHAGIVGMLLEAGAEVEVQDKFACSPLHNAAGKGHVAVVSELLAAGAIVDLQSKDGASELHFAAQNGHVEMVEVLLAAGSAVNLQNDLGRSALHFAARRGHAAVVEALLTGGAAVDLQDNNEEDGNKAVEEALPPPGGHLAATAPEDLQSKQGDTPMDMAVGEEVKALLRAHGGRTKEEILGLCLLVRTAPPRLRS